MHSSIDMSGLFRPSSGTAASTDDHMNEWQLQKELTTLWASEGLVVDGERCMLIAWEVMVPSWRINDAHGFWAEPSVDFLFVTSQGDLVAVELKTSIPGVLPAWRTLCQVTHRAMELEASWSTERMHAAYAAAWSGRHGRVTTSVPRFHYAARRFFGSEYPAAQSGPHVHRAVAAASFGPQFDRVLEEFNSLDRGQLPVALKRVGLGAERRIDREPARLLAVLESMPLPSAGVVRVEIEGLEVAREPF